VKYLPPLTPEQIEVWKTMPLDPSGHVRAIQSFDLPKARDAAEVRWREWCKKTDRHWWPDHLEQWAKIKGSKSR
jgi:hypothetical protein